MKIHYVLPEPMYKHYTVFPDMIGQYADFPEHQEWRSKGTAATSKFAYGIKRKRICKSERKGILPGSRTGLLLRTGS